MSLPLQRHPPVIALGPRAAGARNQIENAFAGGARRETAGSIDVAEHADQRGALVDQGHDHLGLDRAALERFDNGALDFGGSPALRQDGARIGHRNIAAVVDGLIGDGDEIAGANAGFGWNEQAARRGLEYRHADGVADAEAERLRGTSVGESR